MKNGILLLFFLLNPLVGTAEIESLPPVKVGWTASNISSSMMEDINVFNSLDEALKAAEAEACSRLYSYAPYSYCYFTGNVQYPNLDRDCHYGPSGSATCYPYQGELIFGTPKVQYGGMGTIFASFNAACPPPTWAIDSHNRFRKVIYKYNPHNGMCERDILSCVVNKVVYGDVTALMDGCHNGCEVDNLSPTKSYTWVDTLQGVTTGKSCTDKQITDSDVDTGKMMACGKAGVSIDEIKTFSDHPIDFAIGNKFFRDTDYRGSGAFPIVFSRTYNSFALGWNFAYTQRIERQAADKIVVRRPDGQTYKFALNGFVWTSDPDVVERLEWLPNANGGAGAWRLTLANHTRELYDASGRLLAIRNSAGQEQTVSYSADGKEMTIRGPDGDSLQLLLNDTGLLPLSITDTAGRTTSYSFEGLYLRQVTYPNTTTKQYLYEVPERPWLITGIIDENGNRSHSVAYDDQGRAIMSELANGVERVNVSYNDNGTTTLTNALGKLTRFHFQTIHGVKKIVHVEGVPTATCQGTAMDYAFDDNGFLIEKTDAEGVITRFSRDAQGLELSRTDAAGLPEERSVTTHWDSALRKPLVVTEGNTETRYVYDSEGRTLSRTVSDLASGSGRTLRYTYNSQGLLETVDGPREDASDLTTYHYDTNGRLSQVSNALGHTTEIVSRDDYGRPVVTRDANGLETTLSYDGNGRLTTRQVGSETTTMIYDAVGNLSDVAAPGGVSLHYRYDAANRLVGISDAAGNRIEYTLDAMGNRTSEAVYDAGGQLARSQQKVYDELSRLLRSIGADGQTTHYGYDRNDNLTSTFDPLWQLHENSFDALNRLIQQTDPLGGVTRYGYDAQDRLTSVTDPNGNATTYVYDGLGNLLEQYSPDTGTTRYTHDAAGNVLTKTDAKGHTTSYRYDALNRLTQTTYADGSVVSYTYDTAENGIGRLAMVSDPSGEIAWQYDLHGHTTARIQTILLDGTVTQLNTRYHYNSAGQQSGITYPSGLQVGYDYTHGQISGMTLNGQPLLSEIDYQPFGPVSGWSWANGSQSRRGYDLDGRLISQSLGSAERTLGYDANGNITAITDPANSRAYGYDALNRLIAANDATYNLAWQYDANGNRLSQSSDTTTTAYNLDAASNRLLAVDDNAYVYDANGNLINDGEYSYQYNAQDRLIAVDEGAIGEYRYNALGQRIYKKGLGSPCDVNGDGEVDHDDLKEVTGKHKRHSEAKGPGRGEAKGKGQAIACIATQIGKHQRDEHGRDEYRRDEHRKDKHKDKEKHRHREQERGNEILFAYDEHRLLGEYTASGIARQETVWLDNLPVAVVQDGTVYYIHADHLGTPRVITDSSNREVWRWDSDPFGMAAANEDPDGDGVLFAYNLRFSGQYFDAETGLHYNYFRDYDPATGRYVESDPIGLNGGKNTYNYVFSRPLSLTDMFGLSSDETCEPIVIKYYADVEPFQVQPELGYLSDPVCFPVPVPSGGIPDPTSPHRRPSFPSPLDISFQLRCVREWVKTQEEKWDINITMMVQYYLKCKNKCTGEERNIGPTKLSLEEFEKVKDLY